MRRIRLISLVLVLVIAFSAIPVSAGNIDITINDEPAQFSSGSILYNENIMIPLRDMAESLDYKVVWDGTNCRVNLIKVDDVIQVYVNSDKYVYGGVEYTLPCNSVLYGTKTYTPLAFFHAIADMSTVWDYDALKLAINSDAFPVKGGIFGDAPLEAADLQQPYFTDFSDPYDFYKKTASSSRDADNYIGRSTFGAGWYHASAKIEALGGSPALLSWNWYFKLPNFFKGAKRGKFTVRFKARSQTNNKSKEGDHLNMVIYDIGNSVKVGSVVTRKAVYSMLGVQETEWKQFEYVIDYNGDAVDGGEGIDGYALAIVFYSDTGAWYGIDDVEILPVS